MKQWYVFLLAVLCLVMGFAFINGCDDDDDDGDDDDDTVWPDDDDDDDTVAPDDDDVDDDDDDDNLPGPLPVISNAFWDPDTAALDAESGMIMSILTFYVCDPDNNLLGGSIYGYVAGTTDDFWQGGPIGWDEMTSMPDVSDCDNPTEVTIGTTFYEEGDDPWGNANVCLDLEVSDGDGNFSEKLESICVTVP